MKVSYIPRDLCQSIASSKRRLHFYLLQLDKFTSSTQGLILADFWFFLFLSAKVAPWIEPSVFFSIFLQVILLGTLFIQTSSSSWSSHTMVSDWCRVQNYDSHFPVTHCYFEEKLFYPMTSSHLFSVYVCTCTLFHNFLTHLSDYKELVYTDLHIRSPHFFIYPSLTASTTLSIQSLPCPFQITKNRLYCSYSPRFYTSALCVLVSI